MRRTFYLFEEACGYLKYWFVIVILFCLVLSSFSFFFFFRFNKKILWLKKEKKERVCIGMHANLITTYTGWWETLCIAISVSSVLNGEPEQEHLSILSHIDHWASVTKNIFHFSLENRRKRKSVKYDSFSLIPNTRRSILIYWLPSKYCINNLTELLQVM